MAEVERLLAASMVRVEVEDPASPDARWCMQQYFAELDRRFEGGFDPAASISADASELTPPAGALLVARLRRRPVGCGALRLRPDRVGVVKRMWVAPETRGLGLGRRLLRELEEVAREHRVAVLRLETNRPRPRPSGCTGRRGTARSTRSTTSPTRTTGSRSASRSSAAGRRSDGGGVRYRSPDAVRSPFADDNSSYRRAARRAEREERRREERRREIMATLRRLKEEAGDPAALAARARQAPRRRAGALPAPVLSRAARAAGPYRSLPPRPPRSGGLMTTDATRPDPDRWKALAVLGVAYLMVILDVSIVNVALPSIQTDLGFSPEDLQWVVSGYALTFGGFLLLGGRAGDLLGRRKLFMFGLAGFAAFSLMCGLAQTEGMLIAGRILQGAASAVLAPSVFSITLGTFQEGADRNKALGVLGRSRGRAPRSGCCWAASSPSTPAGSGSSSSTCRSPRSRSSSSRASCARAAWPAWRGTSMPWWPSPSPPACCCWCSASPRANQVGWASAQTILVLAASVVLMAAFLFIESRNRHALMPLGFFRRRTPTGANVVGFILGTIVFSMFFLLSLYMQQVLGFSALETGVGYLAVALTAVLASGVAQALVTRVGVKPILAIGLGAILGLIWFTQISVDGTYLANLFGPSS